MTSWDIILDAGDTGSFWDSNQTSRKDAKSHKMLLLESCWNHPERLYNATAGSVGKRCSSKAPLLRTCMLFLGCLKKNTLNHGINFQDTRKSTESTTPCSEHVYHPQSFFSSLSFYHGLDMFLATRDALVINGSCQVFFLSSIGARFSRKNSVFGSVWPPSQQMNDPERKCLAFRQELQPCSYPYRPCIWYICLLIYRINQMWVNTPIHGMGNDWIRSILNDRSSCLACKFRNFVIFSWQHVKMISQNTNSSCTSYMFY